MTQALYAHMNNKTILKKKKKTLHKNRTGGVAQGEGPEIKPQTVITYFGLSDTWDSPPCSFYWLRGDLTNFFAQASFEP
jgi:hypothetical protein